MVAHAAAKLTEPAVLFFCCRLCLLSFISEVALSIVTKLCHMFDGYQDL